MCSSPPAGLAGHLFDNSHKTIAPARQPRLYIRSRELRSVVESAHSNIARKTKGWIKHKIRHMALTGDGQSLLWRARSPNVCAKTFLRPGLFRVNWACRIPAPRCAAIFPRAGGIERATAIGGAANRNAHYFSSPALRPIFPELCGELFGSMSLHRLHCSPFVVFG
jgi:hypothetical protein